MDPLFSIIILVRDARHLLPLTLHSLKSQTEKDFEVVLVADKEMEGQYPELVVQTCSVSAATIPAMMNEGLRKSRGKYLQFLEAGDRFLSQQGLSYVKELIRESGEPHLAYSGFLTSGPDEIPQATILPLSLPLLQKGGFPTVFRSSWFHRETLSAMGGFNLKLTYRSSFDLLCRLFLQPGLRAVYSRRVLTDCEPHRTTSREIVGYATETCRILYRHFGLWPALRWIFVQDHATLLRRSLHLLKRAFQRKT